MRALVIALLVATIALGAWGIGELHYRNCVTDHRVQCSHLPWENGQVRHHERNLFSPPPPNSNGGF